MKHVVGTLCGFLSGFLIYMILSMLFGEIKSESGPPAIAWAGFLIGWVGTHIIATRNTTSALRTFSRGSLIGALEWFAMIFVGMVFSGRAIVETADNMQSTAGKAGAAIGGGLVSVLTGGFSAVMILVCLTGFVIAHLLSRELKSDSSEAATKACPDCAEQVNVNAKKCKHCGAVIGSLAQSSNVAA